MPARRRHLLAPLAALALLGGGCGGGDASSGGGGGITGPPPAPERPVLPPAYRPTGRGAAGDVFVHLFGWRWTDVAAECETVLGPGGWRAVQVAPPQEHVIVAGRPWWERYQPVSYALDRSEGGTGAEFAAMVARCRAAGVDVYVDAVINHMTAGDGVGSAGTAYTKYAYPGLWTRDDFHPSCSAAAERTPAEVQECELLGLADLRTGSAAVRERLAGYLVELSRLGVAGFRIDAAKHIQPVELDDILARVHARLAAEGRAPPYWFAEVIDYGSAVVRAQDYYGLGHASGGAADLTEFRARGIGDKFLPLGVQRPADLRTFSAASWGLVPSDKAVVFLENHDTQRSDGIGYRDGDRFRLATVYLLAQPYGYPSILSGYAFDRTTAAGRDAGPPAGPVRCAARMEDARPGEWTCEHRDRAIAAMVPFRRAVAGQPLAGWWDDGADAIAFSRGDRGFVAINRGTAAVAVDAPTPLPAGTYCDVLSGGPAGGPCAGPSVTVAGGRATLTLAPRTAVAVLAGSRP